MKAVRIHATGGLDVLKYEEVSDPVCRDNEVLVGIKSISINFSDVLIRRGEYPYMPDFPAILGSESSGEVQQVGSQVEHVKVGDRVIVFGHPSYCTLAAVPATKVVPFPDNVDFDAAAALPIIYLTAYHMLHTVRRVQPGETVLIYAAAGGVGTATIQLGRIAGLKMIGLTSQDEKAKLIKEMGIDHVINYRTEPVVERVREITAGKGADLILDCVAGENFGDNFRMLNTLGQVIWFGIADGNPTTDLLKAIGRDPSQSYGVSMFHLFSVMKNPQLSAESFATLIRYLAEGKIAPIIYRKVPLEHAHEAHKILEDHENTGKVILNP
ncbi:MAG: NADPH:quinone oxidoreductase family protein [Cyclobacteriaceae bacterium]|nr:NADPH:quinone oxidoreductase family protein [Cyclobacteriaceae bacterium]